MKIVQLNNSVHARWSIYQCLCRGAESLQIFEDLKHLYIEHQDTEIKIYSTVLSRGPISCAAR